MQEDLLHFIWKFQLFNHKNLQTVDGEPILVKEVGEHNHYAGPDFSHAKVKIGDTLWAGTIEIHIKSSDWFSHQHQIDDAYKSVILHVVWRDDKPTNLPTLELEPIVSNLLLERYTMLMNTQDTLPCAKFIHQFTNFDWAMYRETLIVERLEQKTQRLQLALRENQNNINQLFYEKLAYSFGLTTNADAFLRLAELVHYKLILKYCQNLFQLEALLFGCAGFLVEENLDSHYAQRLYKEFKFLQAKHHLQSLPITIWNFGKIRPANFPTIRIAQFASVLQGVEHLYSKVVEQPTLTQLKEFFKATPSEFWLTHYTFQKESKPKEKKLGNSTIERMIINAVIPMLFLKAKEEEADFEKVFQLYHQLRKEKNAITERFEILQVENKSAFHSQALIHLHKNYCKPKQCVTCKIGYKALNG